MRSHLQPFSSCRPEFPFALGVIGGCAAAAHLLPAVLLAAGAAWLISRRLFLFLSSGIICGLISLGIHSFLLEKASEHLPRRNAGVSLICRSVDSRTTHVTGMPRAASFSAEVLAVNGRKLFFKPRILVRLKKSEPLPRCGEIFSADGSLVAPEHGGRFARYLKARRISKIWYIDSWQRQSPPAGLLFHLTQIRDLLLERCLSGISSDKARIITGAMFFGTAGGFDSDMRSSYISSGTLHLFSVSGMHLAAIAFLLMNALRFLPGKIRYLLSALLLTAYALSTGANPPVMRALTVLLFWISGKIFLFRKQSFDLLSLAAALLFLFNPFLIYDTGTWYSFFITAILILSAQRIDELFRPGSDLLQNLPFSSESRQLCRDYSRCRKVFFAVVLCLAAFAAGIGISAVNGNLIVPGAVFVNLFLLFFVPLLFAAAGLKLITGPLFPPLLFENAILFLHNFCTEAGRSLQSLSPALPPLCEALLFCFLLLGAAASLPRRFRIFCAAASAILFSLWLIRPLCQPPAAVFISHGSSSQPVVLLCEPRENLAFVVNTSSPAAVRKAVGILLQKGLRTPEALLFSLPSASAASAAGTFLNDLQPRKIRLPDRSSENFKTKLLLAGAGNLLHFSGEKEFLQIFREKSKIRLEYFNPGSKLNLRIEWYDTARGRFVSFNNSPPRRIPWGNIPEVIVHEISQ